VLDAQWERYGAMSARDRSRRPPAGSSQAGDWPRVPRRLRTRDDFKRWIDGYDTGIRYMDEHIGQVLATLDELGVLDETALVFSADHGENQGELNVYGDHQTADRCTNRVPLIVRWPGVTRAGARVDALVYQQDLPPAVCELLGVPVPARWDGVSLAPALRGEPFAGRPYLVVGQGPWTCQRAVRTGPWLAVRTYHPGLHPFPSRMLFDLDADPRETTDLSAQRPDVTAACDHLLAEWWQQMLAPGDAAPDPLLTVLEEGGPWYVRARWTAFLDGLRADGQAWAADELEARGLDVRPLPQGQGEMQSRAPAASSS
jgi:choline-sulfatase